MSEVNPSEVSQLERQLDVAKHLIEQKTMAERLAGNRDFRKLILTGFCRDDAARFVQESGDPMLTFEQRNDCLAMAQASGHLKRFLSMQIQMGSTAERNVVELEEALVEARAEEVTDEATAS